MSDFEYTIIYSAGVHTVGQFYNDGGWEPLSDHVLAIDAEKELFRLKSGIDVNAMQSELDRLRRENAELVARINELGFWIQSEYSFATGVSWGDDIIERVPEKVAQVLNRLPSQSLANIRAEAVEEANEYFVSREIKPTHVGLHEYAQSLREREEQSDER